MEYNIKSNIINNNTITKNNKTSLILIIISLFISLIFCIFTVQPDNTKATDLVIGINPILILSLIKYFINPGILLILSIILRKYNKGSILLSIYFFSLILVFIINSISTIKYFDKSDIFYLICNVIYMILYCIIGICSLKGFNPIKNKILALILLGVIYSICLVSIIVNIFFIIKIKYYINFYTLCLSFICSTLEIIAIILFIASNKFETSININQE